MSKTIDKKESVDAKVMADKKVEEPVVAKAMPDKQTTTINLSPESPKPSSDVKATEDKKEVIIDFATAMQIEKKDKKERLKHKIAEQREKDSAKVRGVFRNHETPGSALRFSFVAYKGDRVEKYDLKDETVYSLPYGVVRHLNQNCWYPVHQHAVDEKGKPAISIGRKVRRFSFSPLDFVDESEFPSADKEIVIATPLR